MISCEVTIQINEDSAFLHFNQDGNLYEWEMSREAFEQLAIAMDIANQRGSGWYSAHCFDLDDSEEDE